MDATQYEINLLCDLVVKYWSEISAHVSGSQETYVSNIQSRIVFAEIAILANLIACLCDRDRVHYPIELCDDLMQPGVTGIGSVCLTEL